MAGLFILELDTTSPNIVIYAPNYTTNETEMEIVVKADEVLSDGFQEFYIVDQYGIRHNYTFTYELTQFVGKITLSTFNNGFVTFYARVKDEVHNLSVLASKTIQIIPSVNYLRLSMEDTIYTREQGLSNIVKSIDSSILNIKNNIMTSTSNRGLTVSTKERELDAEDKSDKTEIMTEAVTNNG